MTATATKPDRAEINRRNARRSTGPKTPEGKSRSRFNALKHGMAAKTLVLPGEDPEAFRGRLDAWTENLAPRDEVEQYLVERAVQVSWQLDRADRADVARLTRIIRSVPVEEGHQQAEEAEELGRRLFWDRRGPLALYPHFPLRDQLLGERKPRTSFSGRVDDPDDPARLVSQLESTAAGCQWLLDRWTELRTRLDQGWAWQSPEKLKAIRLLGRQPLDAADDDAVATIFQACWVMGPRDPSEVDPFAELWSELLPGEERILKQRLEEGQVDELLPRDEDHARAVLLDIVERVTAPLKTLAAAHCERAEAAAAEQANRLSFDPSAEGERLRRFQISCGRSLNRTLDTLLKIRRAGQGVGTGESGVERKEHRTPLPAEPGNHGAAESVAETYARILFGPGCDDDGPPAESAFTSVADTGIDAHAWTADPIVCAAAPADPALGTLSEPVSTIDLADSKDETTSEAGESQDLRNEPRASVCVPQDLRNEPAPVRTRSEPAVFARLIRAIDLAIPGEPPTISNDSETSTQTLDRGQERRPPACRPETVPQHGGTGS
jgi:hypothetical protein